MNWSNYALNSPVHYSVVGAPGMSILTHTSYVCPQGCPALNVRFSILRDLEQGIKKKKREKCRHDAVTAEELFLWMTTPHGREVWGWEVGNDVLNSRYLRFGKTRTNAATAILITDQHFPSQSWSFLQKETFFTFCCSSCPVLPFLDTQMGWFSSGPCLATLTTGDR